MDLIAVECCFSELLTELNETSGVPLTPVIVPLLGDPPPPEDGKGKGIKLGVCADGGGGGVVPTEDEEDGTIEEGATGVCDTELD